MKRDARPGVWLPLLIAGALLLAPDPGRSCGVAWAGGAHRSGGFSFSGQGCKQTVSNIEAPLENVAPYMDPRFHCSREELGVCMVSYRMLFCPTLSIDGGPARPILWTELGVRARPPHGVPNTDHVDTHAGDGHDYYMLFFHTNDAELAGLFEKAGAPGLHVADLTFSLPPNGVPAPFDGSERVPDGGVYHVTAQSLFPEDVALALAELILKSGAFPPFHLNAYFVRADGSIVRYQELRTSVTGVLSRYRIEHDEETLLAELTGRGETTYSDAFVLFDVEAGLEVFEDPDCVFDPSCNSANLPRLPLP